MSRERAIRKRRWEDASGPVGSEVEIVGFVHHSALLWAVLVDHGHYFLEPAWSLEPAALAPGTPVDVE